MTLWKFLFFKKTPKKLHPKIGNFEFKSGSYMHTSTNTLSFQTVETCRRGLNLKERSERSPTRTARCVPPPPRQTPNPCTFNTWDRNKTVQMKLHDRRREHQHPLLSHLKSNCCLYLGSSPSVQETYGRLSADQAFTLFPLSLTSKQAQTGCELQVGPEFLFFVLTGSLAGQSFTEAHLRVHLRG